MEDVEINRNRSHPLHQSTRAKCVADVLANAEFQGNVVIKPHALCPAHFDGVDDVVDPLHQLTPVSRADELPLVALPNRVDELLHQGHLELEPRLVDVAESQLPTLVVGDENNVAKHGVGEEAPRAHHHDVDFARHRTRKSVALVGFTMVEVRFGGGTHNEC